MNSAFSAIANRTTEPPISWLMKLTLERPELISLAAGFTDNESLPVAATREVADKLLASVRTGRPALQYGATAGDPELRRLTAKRLSELDQRSCAPEQVLITHGSQQLLYLVSECLCDPGDIVLVEDPTYFVFLGIAQSLGFHCRGVGMQKDGLDIEHLGQRLAALKKSGELKRVKFLYLVTYFQNPSGITTSFEKKTAALELLKKYERAAGHAIYLLEDAAYRELRFEGDDVPSAADSDRVIYAGTYSKPFATGIRVGFGVIPEPLRTVVLQLKGSHDFGTANFQQQIVSAALASCRFEKHVRSLRKHYAKKAAVMVDAIKKHFPDSVEWEKPQGGLYVWSGDPRVKTGAKSKFFSAALNRNVIYVPGELCYCDDPSRPKPNHEMRLSFGGATESDIREGIKRLGSLF
ncbi:MAG TPA: PLP-dependent aminotransferase family protein [Verrucomicrobiae bacterium]|nr:PLP-dependent aminotransferase family protein [Verrucomicrobiae bacterium]